MRIKRVYRVRSTHEKPYKKGETYERTRHFFSKWNAERSYRRFLKAIAQVEEKGFTNMLSPDWGKPLSVEIAESEPLVFRVDEKGLW